MFLDLTLLNYFIYLGKLKIGYNIVLSPNDETTTGKAYRFYSNKLEQVYAISAKFLPLVMSAFYFT